MKPAEIWANKIVFLGILLPAILFLILIVKNPNVLILKNYWGETAHSLKEGMKNATKSKKSNLDKETELNQLLDKIKKSGMKSLSAKEKERLKELSK